MPANITCWEQISGGGKWSTSLDVRAHPSNPSLAYEQALHLGKSRLRSKWRGDSHAKPHLHSHSPLLFNPSFSKFILKLLVIEIATLQLLLGHTQRFSKR